MTVPREIMEGLWTYPIVLPNNPLKWLNCYVVKAKKDGRNLLIDTGFNMHECKEALLQGIEKIGLALKSTDVFFTHMHSDHTGLAYVLQEKGCRLLMSESDYKTYLHNDDWCGVKKRALIEGMPKEVLERIFKNNPAIVFSSKPFTVDTVREGESLNYGEYSFECISTPGHTPGHMCLYDRSHKIMILGDHVLFDITPNISIWESMDDALGTYIDSLNKIKDYEVEIALPAHRNTGDMSMSERIDLLINHHERRLEEAEEIVRSNPGAAAYDIAGKMCWRIKAENWDDFPIEQKWFAFGECLTHLDYLSKRRRIHREEDSQGRRYYYPAASDSQEENAVE